MTQFLSYLFWPNPPAPAYGSPKVMAILILCFLMLVAAFAVSRWRKSLANPVTKKLSVSWPKALYWFGFSGLFMAICRVEGISFLSMRAFWGVWIIALVAFAALQVKIFRMRHYEILPREKTEDARERYLPGKKKR